MFKLSVSMSHWNVHAVACFRISLGGSICGCVRFSFGSLVGMFFVLALPEEVRATAFLCADACFICGTNFLYEPGWRSSNLMLPSLIYRCVRISFGRLVGRFVVLAVAEEVRAIVFLCARARFTYATNFLYDPGRRSSNLMLPTSVCGCARFCFRGLVGSFCVLATA